MIEKYERNTKNENNLPRNSSCGSYPRIILPVCSLRKRKKESRQGIPLQIRLCMLLFLEEKLGLAKKMRALRIHADNMMNIANTEEIPSSLRNEIKEISNII